VFKNVQIECQLRRSFDQSSSRSSPSESVPDSVVQSPATSALKDVPSSDINKLSTTTPPQALAHPIHYFIMKSLTRSELAWSVANSVWTTQSHNERALNEAFTVNFFSISISAAH